MTNSVFGSEYQQDIEIAEVIRAELYTRLYKWASEDFVNYQDFKKFEKSLLQWVASVEKRLVTLGANLAKHTHPIAPHTHPGTGPNIGGLKTLIPTSPTSLKWTQRKAFNAIENTTGAKTNLNNRIINRNSPAIGDSIYATGRSEQLPALKSKNYNKVVIRNVN